MINVKPDKLAKKLRYFRSASGLTQEELASAAGISGSTVAKLEQGKIGSPSAEVMISISRVLRFDLDDFFQAVSTQPKKRAPSYVKRPKISFIYFDIGGVLVHTESAFLQPLSLRLNRPLNQVKAVYHSYAMPACRGKLSLNDMQLLMLLKLNVRFKGSRKKAIFKHWVDDFEPLEVAHEFAEELSETYPIGILTNTIDGFVERMQKNNLLPDIGYKTIVKSSDLGLVKPEKAIYDLAAKRAKTPPAHILFIDNERPNVEAAKRAGWQAEWFNELKPEASISRIRRKYLEQ
ncbi:MAG: HAD-IA family hydrolase [Candidatus Saccharimonadales bacterium]